MTLDELKNYPNGVCFGYSSIGYLIKNVYPYNSVPDKDGYVPLGIYKEYDDCKVYPILMYYKNSDGKEGILCRPMIYKDNLLKPIGILHHNVNPNGIPKYKQICYVAKTVNLPLDTDIDSIYEVMREPIIVKG